MPGTFAHDLQPTTKFVYDSDDGQSYLIKMEAKYTEASGLTAATSGQLTTVKPYPRSQRYLRHTYISSADSTGKVHRRKVPVSHAEIGTPTAISTAIDGLTGWARGGIIGERFHG
jgi:hypothetical protein